MRKGVAPVGSKGKEWEKRDAPIPKAELREKQEEKRDVKREFKKVFLECLPHRAPENIRISSISHQRAVKLD